VTSIEPDDLEIAIRDYFDWKRKLTSKSRVDRLEAEQGNELDDWLDRVVQHRDAPADEDAWPVVLALIERAPDNASIGAVAAGPLEDLVVYHGAQFGARVVEETRRNPLFRKAMAGVWGLERMPEPYRGQLLTLLDAE
jgi:hypothetical protein